jgi:hypothetical protein
MITFEKWARTIRPMMLALERRTEHGISMPSFRKTEVTVMPGRARGFWEKQERRGHGSASHGFQNARSRVMRLNFASFRRTSEKNPHVPDSIEFQKPATTAMSTLMHISEKSRKRATSQTILPFLEREQKSHAIEESPFEELKHGAPGWGGIHIVSKGTNRPHSVNGGVVQ